MSEPEPDLVTIRILGLPVKLYRASAEHHDELRREFALIHHGDDHQSVPARLERLIADMNARFGVFTAQPRTALHDAIERGDETVDLVYRVPAAAGAGALELDAMLDEVNAFCEAGEHLLTLAITGTRLAFRRWFLQEFTAQAAGQPPTPWEEYAARSSPATP